MHLRGSLCERCRPGRANWCSSMLPPAANFLKKVGQKLLIKKIEQKLLFILFFV
jgi:hypothetical protein